MQQENIIKIIQEKYSALRPLFDERTRRLWASVEAKALGHGGQTLVAKAIGMARSTITIGLRELEEQAKTEVTRVRSPGGGRKRLIDYAPSVKPDLEALVAPATRGEPESPLRWTCKSTRQLAATLQEKGDKIGKQKVAYLLHEQGFSLQANRKTMEGASHPDRAAQFRYINNQVVSFQKHGQPVVSGDTKKKSWWGSSRTGAGNGNRKGSLNVLMSMILLTKNLAR